MGNQYTVKEAAEKIGVSDSRVRQLVLAGEIDHSYFGKSLVISDLGIEQAKNRKGRGRPKNTQKKKGETTA